MIKKLFLLSLLMLMLFVPLASQAQTQPAQLLINYPEVGIGTGDRTAFGIYFTILDRNGLAISGSGTSNASIIMDTGTRYDAQVSQPNTPLHIILLLDMSGSMGPAANAMKTAAVEAVQAAPAGTLFEVITFNRQVNLVQSFTSERTAVINAIASANPPPPSDPNAGTCLYDAMIQALAQMDSIPLPNRRTIVLFTDGRDELTRGGAVCSRATYENVLDRATRLDDPIAINTIGLSGDRAINEDELRDLARRTGGLAAIGGQSDLGALFGQIINGLASQQVARTEICEPAGARSATLTVQVSGALLSNVVTFQNTRACAPATAVPVALVISAMRFDDKAEEVSFEVIGQGLDNVGRYRIEIYDRNGSLVRQLDEPAPLASSVVFSSDNIADGAIEIRLIAFDNAGIILAREDARFNVIRPTAIPTPTFTPLPTSTITPTPEPVSATITAIQYIEESDSVNINLLLLTPQQISRIEVDIVDENNILRIPARPDVAETVNINISELRPQGRYNVRVTAFNASGEIVSVSNQNFTNPKVLTPTDTPTPTPVISANVDTIVPVLDEGRIILNLELQSPEAIGEITIDILDGNNTLVRTITMPEVDVTTSISLEGLVPQGAYKVRVVARDNNGAVLSRQVTDFTNPIVPSPTPSLTPTPTVEPTPTAIVVLANIESVETDDRQENFTITLRTENIERIVTYRLDIIDDNAGNLLASQEFSREEVGNRLTMPIGTLSEGKYRLRVIAFDADGRVLHENVLPVGYTPFTPTPTPVPPNFVQQLGRTISDQPIVGVIIAIIILLLVFLLFWLIRSARQRDKDLRQPSLPNMTGAINIEELRQLQMQQGLGQQAPYGADMNQDIYGEQPTGSFMIMGDGDATNVPSGYDPNMTNAQILATGFEGEATNVFLPATLRIVASLDMGMVGQTIIINKPYFFIGRTGKRENDLNVEGDKNISREHADIYFEGGGYFIEDKPNTHGVKVNDEKVSGRYPLGQRATIKLGETTVIEFEMTTSTSQTASY